MTRRDSLLEVAKVMKVGPRPIYPVSLFLSTYTDGINKLRSTKTWEECLKKDTNIAKKSRLTQRSIIKSFFNAAVQRKEIRQHFAAVIAESRGKVASKLFLQIMKNLHAERYESNLKAQNPTISKQRRKTTAVRKTEPSLKSPVSSLPKIILPNVTMQAKANPTFKKVARPPDVMESSVESRSENEVGFSAGKLDINHDKIKSTATTPSTPTSKLEPLCVPNNPPDFESSFSQQTKTAPMACMKTKSFKARSTEHGLLEINRVKNTPAEPVPKSFQSIARSICKRVGQEVTELSANKQRDKDRAKPVANSSRNKTLCSSKLGTSFCCGQQIDGRMVMCNSTAEGGCAFGGWFHYTNQPRPCVQYKRCKGPWYCPKCLATPILNEIASSALSNNYKSKCKEPPVTKKAPTSAILTHEDAYGILGGTKMTEQIYDSEVIRGMFVSRDAFLEVFDTTTWSLRPRQYQILLRPIIKQAGFPCSFFVHYKKDYIKTSDVGLAQVVGKCGGKSASGCELHFILTFLGKLDDEKIPCSLTVTGRFVPHNSKRRCRPVNGLSRTKLRNPVRARGPAAIAIEQDAELSTEEVVHGNFYQKSVSVFRNINWETKKTEMELQRTTPLQDLLQLKADLRLHPDAAPTNKRLSPGFIHSMSADDIEFNMYLSSQAQLVARAKVRPRLHLDLAQSVIEKINDHNPSLYSLVAGFPHSEVDPLPVFEVVSETMLNSKRLASHLTQFQQQCQIVNSSSLPSAIVTDFSLCMLHSVSQAFNNESLDVYINREYRRMNGDSLWLQPHEIKSSLLICQSHMVKALKEKARKIDMKNNIQRLAVILMESQNRDDLVKSIEILFKIFLADTISAKEADELKILLDAKANSAEELEKWASYYENAACLNIEEEEKEADFDGFVPQENNGVLPSSRFLQREKSQFYHLFLHQKAAFQENQKCQNQSVFSLTSQAEVNQYKSVSFIAYIENYIFPYYPLWGQATHQGIVEPGSNATVESYFRSVKHCFNQINPEGSGPVNSDLIQGQQMDQHMPYVTKFVRRQLQVVRAYVKRATAKGIGRVADTIDDVDSEDATNATETYKKRPSSNRDTVFIRKLVKYRSQVPTDKERKLFSSAASNCSDEGNDAAPSGVHGTIIQHTTQFDEDLLRCFGKGQYYSDELMLFYMKLLLKKHKNKQKRMYLLSNFFLCRVRRDKGKLTWEDSKCVFPKIPQQFLYKCVIFMPAFYIDHWFLLRIEPKQRRICTWDSKRGHISAAAYDSFMRRLKVKLVKHFPRIQQSEWRVVKVPNCPQQRENDCGPFVLLNTEALITKGQTLANITDATVQKMRRQVAQIYLNASDEGRTIWSKFGGNVEDISQHYAERHRDKVQLSKSKLMERKRRAKFVVTDQDCGRYPQPKRKKVSFAVPIDSQIPSSTDTNSLSEDDLTDTGETIGKKEISKSKVARIRELQSKSFMKASLPTGTKSWTEGVEACTDSIQELHNLLPEPTTDEMLGEWPPPFGLRKDEFEHLCNRGRTILNLSPDDVEELYNAVGKSIISSYGTSLGEQLKEKDYVSRRHRIWNKDPNREKVLKGLYVTLPFDETHHRILRNVVQADLREQGKWDSRKETNNVQLQYQIIPDILVKMYARKFNMDESEAEDEIHRIPLSRIMPWPVGVDKKCRKKKCRKV